MHNLREESGFSTITKLLTHSHGSSTGTITPVLTNWSKVSFNFSLILKGTLRAGEATGTASSFNLSWQISGKQPRPLKTSLFVWIKSSLGIDDCSEPTLWIKPRSKQVWIPEIGQHSVCFTTINFAITILSSLSSTMSVTPIGLISNPP